MARRRRHDDTPTQTIPASEGATMTTPTPAPTVNLRSQKSIEKLLRDLQDADRRAREARENRSKALADAERIAKAIEDLNRRESEIRAELDLIARKRTEFKTHEQNALAYAENQLREGAAADDEAADSRALLDAAGIEVDPNLLVPTVPVNGQVTPPTRPMVEVDPTDSALDEHMRAFNAAHDEQAAAEPEAEL